MFGKNDGYTPQQQNDTCSQCSFHIKGCCFDPAKNNKGFLAAPCFGCLDLEEKRVPILDFISD